MILEWLLLIFIIIYLAVPNKIHNYLYYLAQNLFVSIEGKKVTISYYVNGSKYKVLFPSEYRSISRIESPDRELTDTEQDILQEYLGFDRNFHGIPTTPEMLGFDEDLKVHYVNGGNATFSSKETITLNPLKLTSSRTI